MTWELVAASYFAYLTAVATLKPPPRRGRRRAIGVSVAMIALLILVERSGGLDLWLPRPAAAVLPAAVLLAGYWASGLFFAGPMHEIEQRLLAWDRRWLVNTGLLDRYGGMPSALRAFFECSYLLTYLMAPAGALTLALASPGASLNRFWVAVLAAGLGSYAVLPWVQTRPPRVLETRGASQPTDTAGQSAARVRGLNLRVLDRASIGVNTIPSGHAAVAMATALALAGVDARAGAVFLLLAASITVATVTGRYHYLLDSVLGVAVAVAAWALALHWA